MRIDKAEISLIIVVWLFAGFLGCAGAEKAGGKALAAGQVYPASGYLSATGLGLSEGEAKNQAVAGLSRIFESTVMSETLDRVRTMARITEGGTDEATEQRLESRVRVVSGVELKGVEIAKTWRENGTYYATAVLEKQKARDNWLRDIKDIDRRIKGRLKGLDRLPGRLLRYKSLKAVSDLWIEREAVWSRVRVLGFSQAVSSPYDINSVFQKLPEIKSSMPVFLDISGKEASLVGESLAEALGRAGFVVTDSPGGAAVVVEGRVEVAAVDIEHPEWKYARAGVSLSVLDADAGLSVGEVSVEKRSSHLNYEEAAARALRKVAARIAGELVDYLEEEGSEGPLR
jgi:hypothetical protein